MNWNFLSIMNSMFLIHQERWNLKCYRSIYGDGTYLEIENSDNVAQFDDTERSKDLKK